MNDETKPRNGIGTNSKLSHDARRYQWLRENWQRVLTTNQWRSADTPVFVAAIELGSPALGRVDPDSLDAAIDVAMSCND